MSRVTCPCSCHNRSYPSLCVALEVSRLDSCGSSLILRHATTVLRKWHRMSGASPLSPNLRSLAGKSSEPVALPFVIVLGALSVSLGLGGTPSHKAVGCRVVISMTAWSAVASVTFDKVEKYRPHLSQLVLLYRGMFPSSPMYSSLSPLVVPPISTLFPGVDTVLLCPPFRCNHPTL